MNDAAVVAVLARADRASDLPQLGGMARPRGVAIVSSTAGAFAGVEGGLRTFRLPRPPRATDRIPLVRGLVKLAYALTPLFARRVASARAGERWLLAALFVVAFAAPLLPQTLGTAAAAGVTAAIAVCMFRGRTLFLHGAEHRAIAAAEARCLVAAWAGDARPSRISPRCGTNFAALAVLVNVALGALGGLPIAPVGPLATTLLSLMLTTELWRAVQRRGSRVARGLLAPGLALQRLTTREPRLEETRVALRAVAAVLAEAGI